MQSGGQPAIWRRMVWPLLLMIALSVAAFLLADERTDLLLANTIWLAVLCGLICLPIGTALAAVLFMTDLPGRRFFRFLIIAWLFMPAYLQVAGWTAGFGLQGWFSRQVFLSEAVAILDGWRGAVLLQAIVAIPWVTLIVGTGMQALPRHLAEQAQLDLRPWQVLMFVVLPLAAPSVGIAGLWVFILTSCDITITDVFQIRTYAEEIFTGFALGDSLDQAQIRALPGAILVAGLCVIALIVCRSIAESVSATRMTTPWRLRLRSQRWSVFLVTLTIMMLLVGVPIGNLVYKAGIDVDQEGEERIRQWSVTKFVDIVSESPFTFAEEMAWSILLGQLASLAVVAIAIPWAWLARFRPTVRLAGWTLVVLGLSIPGPIIALGLGRLVNQPDSDVLFYLYDRTLFLPWLTLAIRSFPFAFLIGTVAFQRLPRPLLDSAATDGAGRWSQLLYIAIPQSGASIACIWIVSFVVATADLSASILAVPPGVTTVAIRTFNLVHYGVEDYLAGLCLLTTLAFALLAAIVVWLASIARSNRGDGL